MLKNEDIVEEFKKSLISTTKSISKNDKVEVNFIKANSSIEGNFINLTEPNIESVKNNLTYLRAEADALALEFRFHSKAYFPWGNASVKTNIKKNNYSK